MKHIRSAIAAGLLVFGTAAVASAQAAPAAPRAQGQHGQHGMRAGKGERGALLKGIQLSAAEKANLKAVHAKYAPQMKALREQMKNDTSRVARRDAMKRLFDAQRNDLRAALTPANQAKFDANVQKFEQRVAQRSAKGKGAFKRRAPGPRA